MAVLTGIEPASPARQAGRFSRCVQDHGGYGWTRTSDPPLFRRVLYQLSYDAVVHAVGVEPTQPKRLVYSQRDSPMSSAYMVP